MSLRSNAKRSKPTQTKTSRYVDFLKTILLADRLDEQADYCRPPLLQCFGKAILTRLKLPLERLDCCSESQKPVQILVFLINYQYARWKKTGGRSEKECA
jgi:hypothetical protein